MKLREAAEANNVKKMEELVAAGASVNAEQGYQNTVLKAAVSNGSTDAVRFLLAHSLKAEDFPRYEGSLIHIAAAGGHAEIIRLLLAWTPAMADRQNNEQATPLHAAAAHGREAAVRALLELKPQFLEAKDWQGNTALHLAANNGHAETVALLVEKGANVNARNKESRTPLFLAQKQNYDEVADILRPVTATVRAPGADAAPPEEWRKMSGECVAHISVEDAIGYRITEIFNFTARERTTLYQNLKTKREAVEIRRFDEIGDDSAVEEAFEELRRRGGTTKADAVGGLGKKRLAP
jgi:hypothetical protein